MSTVAIVGASLAGLSAARALRSQGFDGRLRIIGDEVHRPYDRPPLSKDFLVGTLEPADLALEADEEEDLQAEWVLGSRAVALDAPAQAVVLDDGSRIRADRLVLATGARARELPGVHGLAGVHTLRTVDDAMALRDELLPGRRLVVIGAGFIGAETAATAHALGLQVTVVEATAAPLSGALGAQMGAVVCQLHADHGVQLLCGSGVHRLIGHGRVQGVQLTDGRVLPADAVVVGVGARPNVEWLAGSGLELANGVSCDLAGATNIPGVVAVGDCAAWHDPRLGGRHRVEHWTGAFERPAAAVTTLLSGGSLAGAAALGLKPPYFWSDQYDVRIQFAGHAQLADEVSVEEGDVAQRSFLAVYRRAGQPVAVLAMNQVRSFTRWRRGLNTVPQPT